MQAYDISACIDNSMLEDAITILMQSAGIVEKDKTTLEYIPPERKIRTRVVQEPKNEIVHKSLKNKRSIITIIDTTDFELDSDDDLEPYDLSNDVQVSKKLPPAYLRDLRDGLLENKDAELFTLSMENCEKIILSQLPHDDVSIGLEILEILISLTPTVYVENFDTIVFQSCIAITCIYPEEYAEYLSKQFHTERSMYSITHRVLMLDILQESAKMLSNINPSKGIEKLSSPIVEKIEKKSVKEIADEIIRKRLESNTRRFITHKYSPKTFVNKFANVAGSFFYPLLHGFGKSHFIMTKSQYDSDHILLINYLNTLSVLMCCAQNCPIAPKMGHELLSVVWRLWFHREAKIRMSMLSMIACIVINIPASILILEFIDELIEFRLRLSEMLSPRGEINSECKILAQHVMYLLDSVLKEGSTMNDC